MAEVTAVTEVEAHELVAGLEARHEHGHIGLCAAVGLDVGILGAEEPFDAFAGEVLGEVDHLAAAVVTVTGIALGILVGEARAHGLHHLVADEVLAGNQFDTLLLALVLLLYNLKNFVVSFHKIFQYLRLMR